MEITQTNKITPDGTPGEVPGNPSSLEAGPMDSGRCQPLFVNKTSESKTSGRYHSMIQQTLDKSFFSTRHRSHSVGSTPLTSLYPLKNNNKTIQTPPDVNNNEGEWTTVLPKKRPRCSPDQHQGKPGKRRQVNLDGHWLSAPVTVSNSFEGLDNEEISEPAFEYGDKNSKPPLIFVDKVENIIPLTKLLNDTVKENYELKILRAEQVKIQPKSTTAYSVIVKELRNKGTEFHTFKLKQDRSFRVVLKNMHPLTDVQELKMAIEERGHNVVNIWNIKQRVTKKPLPMFFIDLEQTPNNKSVYTITHLLQCKSLSRPLKLKEIYLSVPIARGMATLKDTAFTNRDA